MRFAKQWSWCTVGRIRDVAPLIREITLQPDRAMAPCPLGSHVNVSLLIDGQPQTRCYSLVGDHRDAERYRIAVRLAPDSRGGSRAMWALCRSRNLLQTQAGAVGCRPRRSYSGQPGTRSNPGVCSMRVS